VTAIEPLALVEATVNRLDGVGPGASLVNVAVAERLPRIVTVQVAELPEQAPPQPPKLEPFSGVAVRVTEDESSKAELQVAPQLIPAGAEVMVPEPSPDFEVLRS
jgi:hypothetical protein